MRSPTGINRVLVSLPQPVWDGLVAAGYGFSLRGAPSEGIRIVCALDATEEAVGVLLTAAHLMTALNTEPTVRPPP